jgi:hypothetical protein
MPSCLRWPVGRKQHVSEVITLARRENPAFARIMDSLVQPTLERFAHKSLDYGDGAQTLGIRGQFADINRKVLKLKRAMWDGVPLTDESLTVVLAMDMVRETEPVKEDGGMPTILHSDTWCEQTGCIIRGRHLLSAHGVLR